MLVQLTEDTPLTVVPGSQIRTGAQAPHFSQPMLADADGVINTNDARTTIMYGPSPWTAVDLTSQGVATPLPSTGAASITVVITKPMTLISPPPTQNQTFTWANLGAYVPFDLQASPDTFAKYVTSDKQTIACVLAPDVSSQPVGPIFYVEVSSYDLNNFLGSLTVTSDHGEGYRTGLYINPAPPQAPSPLALAIKPGVGLDQTYPSATLLAHPQVLSPADPSTSYFDLFFSPVPNSFAPLTAATVAIFDNSTSLPFTQAQIVSNTTTFANFDLASFKHVQLGSGTLTPASYYWIVAYVADAANNVTLSTPIHIPLDAYAPVVLTSAISQSFSNITVSFTLRETSLWTAYLYVLTGVSDSAAMTILNSAQAQAVAYQVYAMSNGSTTTLTSPYAINSLSSKTAFPSPGPFRLFLRITDEVSNTTTMDLGQNNLVQAINCNLTNSLPYFASGTITTNINLDQPSTTLPNINILDSKSSSTYQANLAFNTPTQIQAQWVSDTMNESVYNNIRIDTPYGSQQVAINTSVIVDRTIPSINNVAIDASNPGMPSASVTFQTFDANYKDSVVVISLADYVNVQNRTAIPSTNNTPYSSLSQSASSASTVLFVTSPTVFFIKQGDGPNASININVTGLTFATDYKCIIQSRDLAGNVSAVTQQLFYTPDVSPPVISTYYSSSYQTSDPRKLTSVVSVKDIGRTQYPVKAALLPAAQSLSTAGTLQQIHDFAVAQTSQTSQTSQASQASGTAFTWTTITSSDATSVSNTSFYTTSAVMNAITDGVLMYIDIITQDQTTLKNLGVYNIALAYSITTSAGTTPIVAKYMGNFRPDKRLFRTTIPPSGASIESTDKQAAQYLIQGVVNAAYPVINTSIAYARGSDNTIYAVDQREGQSLLDPLTADSQYSLYVLEQPAWAPPNPDSNVITHVDVISTTWTIPYLIQKSQSFTINVYTASGYLNNGPVQALFTDSNGHTLQLTATLTGTYLAYGAQHSVAVNSNDCTVLSKFTKLTLLLPLTTTTLTMATTLLFYFDLVDHPWSICQSHIENDQRHLDITVQSVKDNLLRVREVSATNPVVQMQRIYNDPNDISFSTGISDATNQKYESYQIDLTRLLPGQYYAAVFYKEDDGSTNIQVWPVMFNVSTSVGLSSADLKARPIWLYQRAYVLVGDPSTSSQQISWMGGANPTPHYLPSTLDLSAFNQPAGSSEVSFALETRTPFNMISPSTRQFVLDTDGSWVHLDDSVISPDMQHPVGLDIDWSSLFTNTFTILSPSGLFVTSENAGNTTLSKVRSGSSYTPEIFTISPINTAGSSTCYNVVSLAAASNRGTLQYDATNSRFVVVGSPGTTSAFCITMTPDGTLKLTTMSSTQQFASQSSTNSLTLTSAHDAATLPLTLYLYRSDNLTTPVNILDVPDQIVNQYSLETQSTIQGMRSIICTTAEPVAAITNSFSISCWVQLHGKAVTFSVGRAFFEWSINGTGQAAQASTWVNLWYNGSHYQTALSTTNNVAAIGDGSWHNIVLTAIVAGQTTVFSMYSDGVILFNWSASSMQALPQDAVLSMLGSPTTKDQQYSVVDEISLWAGTLTTQEVVAIWNKGGPSNLSRMVSNSLLLLWYRFEQPLLTGNSTELVLDYSGRGNSASVYGSGSILETISFSPSQTTYILPWNVLSSSLQSITILIVVSGNEFSLRLPYTYIPNSAGVTSYGSLAVTTDNYMRVKIRATQGLQLASATSSTPLVTNAANVIAVTADSAGGLVIRQKAASDSSSGTVTYSNASFASTFSAALPYIASVSRIVTSKGTVLNHLSLYNSALTPSQLSQLLTYSSQTLLSSPTPAVKAALPTLKAWYVFTNIFLNADSVLDLSGNGYSIQTSLFSNNTALFNQFDGINATQISLINRGGSVFPSLQLANAGWTFTTWIRFPNANLPQPSWCSQWSDANSATRAIFILSSGLLIRFKRNDSRSRLIATFNTSIADNKWHHVAVSVASNYSYHVFLDGQENCTYAWEQGSYTPPLTVSMTGQVPLETFSNTSAVQFSIASLSAGSSADDSSTYASWVGADDIALYATVLPQSALQTLASSQTIDLNTTAQNTNSDLRFWYRFEDIPTASTDGTYASSMLVPTAIVDSSGHGNDAVISNFANLISTRVLGDPFAADSFFGLGMDVIGSLQSLTSQSQLHDQEIASLTDTDVQLTNRVSKLETGKNQFASPVQILASQVTSTYGSPILVPARVTSSTADSVLELAGTASSTIMDMSSGSSQSSFAVSVKWIAKLDAFNKR